MRNIWIVYGVFLMSVIACDTNDVDSKDKELLLLEKQLMEIRTVSESVACEDAENWVYTPIGEKACGGPVGYIAYSKNMDTDHFLSLVAEYRLAQMEFNKKWNIISDCLMEQPPVRIDCIEGLALLIYE